MPLSVWKFPLKADVNEIPMPIGAVVLSIEEQDGAGMMWALVNPRADMEIRTFHALGTGWMLSDDILSTHDFRGTFQAGHYVWHLFEPKR